MEKLANEQAKLGKTIDACMDNYYKDGKARKTHDYFNRRLKKLEDLWRKFFENHQNLLSFQASNPNHAYFEEDFFGQVETTYEDLKSELEANIRKREATNNQETRTSDDAVDELDRQIRKQEALLDSLERAIQTARDGIQTPQSRAFYQQHLTNLKEYWNTINKNHHELIADDDSSKYKIEKYTALEIQYQEISIKLIELSDIQPSSNLSSNQQSQQHQHQSMVRLPKITIPTFTGDYSKWKQFHDLFLNLIHTHPMADSQKMFYLKSNLSGEPSRLIQHLQISDENYKTAWDLLRNRYDNKRLIVSAFLNSIFSINAMSGESANSLKKIHDTVNEALQGIKNQGIPTINWDPLILHILLQKVDKETHRLFEQGLESPREIPSLESLLKFMESRFQLLETLGNKAEREFQREKRVKRNTAFLTTNQHNQCSLCKKYHTHIRNCPAFMKLSPHERLKFAKQTQRCLNCLKQGHVISACCSRGCLKCNARHNTLIHIDEKKHDQSTDIVDTSKVASHAAINKEKKPSSYVFLSTAIIDIESKHGQFSPARAILDSGSQLNFITERLVKKLGFSIPQGQTNINGIGHLTLQAKGRINFTIHSKSKQFVSRIEAVILPEITTEQPSHIINTKSWPIPSNIQLADPEFSIPRRVDLLLGAAVYSELMLVGQIKLANDLPTLQNSTLGWVVLGRVTRQTDLPTYLCGISTISLETQLEKFWTLEESTSKQPTMTEAEKSCENHFKNHTRRDTEGRFIVKLPFKQSPTSLGESKDIAIRRFLNIEKRLQKQPELKLQYTEFMKELISLNHMEPANKIPQHNYFLPHHCVLKPESTSTKLRVVFDGSCKTSTNLSLNDILFVGPTVQDELFTILIRFRLYKYVFTADITKMYRQILVSEADRDYQMIVWRDTPEEGLKYYKLRTVTYGTASAPYLATKCLQKLAEDEGQQHPLGAKALKRDFYVDDVMTGANNLQEALNIQRELIKILNKGGFPLRKWSANNIQLLQTVPKKDVETMINIGNDDGDEVKTLGLTWCPTSDKFSIKPNIIKVNRITKRNVLSDIAHIYDPLGLVNPVVTLGKIFIQQLWQLKITWDEAIPQELHTKWTLFRQGLEDLKRLQIPRHVTGVNTKEIQVHGFADASEKAYGAALYIRSTDLSNCTTVKLLCAKSRVAPLKKTTLPRLELCAAHLMTQLVKRIREILKIHPKNTFYWTDSTITLAWINKESSSLKTFVANRVSYIQQNSNIRNWKHVPTKLNPADLISRGMTARQLLSSTLWLNGPEFLKNISEYWPTMTPAIPEEVEEYREEIRNSKLALSIVQDNSVLSQINHRNSFQTLQHIVAYMLRFARSNKNERQRELILEPQELQEALYIIIRQIQNQHFQNEIKVLSQKSEIGPTSKIKSLMPFIDERGLIRVGGRIQAADIAYDAKHPLLLPQKDNLVKLLLTHIHIKHLHAGPQALLAITRQQFWPLGGRILAQSIVRNCMYCSRQRPKLLTQIMGNLPPERLQPNRPFMNVGVDFFGPITIHYKIRGKRPTKAYSAIFICFSTKAVHMELVSDLTKDAFIGALKRFIGRRGKPSKIYCDNATNFVGASNELAEVRKLFTERTFQDQVKLHCLKDSIEWNFIPPRTPHFGGLWEAAVKSAKHYLRPILRNVTLTFEELNTVLIEIEAILNSRPLTPLSNNPDDLSALTPGHFLIGEPLTALPNPQAEETQTSLLQRWKLVKAIQEGFWKRWSKEYLQQLQQRTKWQQKTSELKPGTLVLLKNEGAPPLKWPLGRIIRQHKGPDGFTRVVDIKVENGITQRAIHNLCPLPLESEFSTAPEVENGINATIRTESTSESKTKPSTTMLVTSNTCQKGLPKRSKIYPINPAWLKAPFKRCSSLQQYYMHREDPPEEQPAMKRLRNATGSKLLTIMLAICMAIFPATNATNLNDSVEITPWDHHPAIFFEDIAPVFMVTDKWDLIVYYDLNNYWKEFNTLRNQITKLQNICSHSSKVNEVEYCKFILLQFHKHMDLINSNNEILLERNGATVRAKRAAPLNIIGTVSNKLFGLLDQEYADQMTSTINKISKNENHLLELIKNQTSIIDATENIIKGDREYTDQQFSLINEYLAELKKMVEDSELDSKRLEISHIFNTISIYTTLMMTNYQRIQTALIDIITDCHNGKINPLIITPEQLRKELAVVRENIPPQLMVTGRSDHADLLQLYNMMTVHTRVTVEYVLFNLNIPLLNKEVFQLFKLVPIPLTIRNKFVQVELSTNFLAVSLHRDHYYAMTQEDVSQCLKDKQENLICRKKHAIYHKAVGTSKCELSILNYDGALSEDCKLEPATPDNKWIQLHNPNHWIYILKRTSLLNIVCGTTTYPTTLNGTGLLKFKSNCVIKQDAVTISAHSRYGHKTDNSFPSSPILSINLFEKHLNEQEHKQIPHLLLVRNNTQEISNIKEKLVDIQNKQQLPEGLDLPEFHEVAVSYSALGLLILLTIAYIIRKCIRRRRPSKATDNIPPEPTPQTSKFKLRTKTARSN